MLKTAVRILYRLRTKLVGAVGFAALVSLLGCVGAPPIEDYTIAHTSIEAARQAQAPRFAPGLFSQAEEFYRQALADYEERRYNNAQSNFQRAKVFAEKAENYTVLKKSESGEVQ